jgi:hypothetical protein
MLGRSDEMTRSRCTLAAAPLLLAAPFVLFAEADKTPALAPAREKEGLPLLFHEDFKDGDKAMARFELLDPSDWRIDKDGDRTVLSLFRKPTPESAGSPPVRRPFGQALVKGLYVGPFVMEVKLRSTIKPYGHQDLCLFFGQVDVSHGYYAHLGREPDPNAGNVFIVNGAPRKNLLPALPKDRGVPWTDGWHTVRVVRGDDGRIEVFFDGKSWVKLTDNTFPVGQVGFGSFDDTGNFAEITIWGRKADKPVAPPQAKKAK